jgi:hypothetical protein
MHRVCELFYNPFEGKTELYYENPLGKKPVSLPCMGNGNNSRLPEWIHQFFPDLKKKFNLGDRECLVKFRGTSGNFEDLEDAHKKFREENRNAKISVEHVNNKEVKDLGKRLSNLKSLFERMQKDSPYPELKDEERKKNGRSPLSPDFEKALLDEFEISVIATISSGKSTLINALLGQELLPTRHEPTTAKIARIKNKKIMTGRRILPFAGSRKTVKKQVLRNVRHLKLWNVLTARTMWMRLSLRAIFPKSTQEK